MARLRLLAKQGSSSLHLDKDQKLLNGSRRIVKSFRRLRTLRDTCSMKVLVVEELSNKLFSAKLTQRYCLIDLP